jgi:hypothetical protein
MWPSNFSRVSCYHFLLGPTILPMCSQVSPDPALYTQSVISSVMSKYKYSSVCFYPYIWGHAVVQLVEALCYKPHGREFDSRWGNLIFQLT